VGQTEKKKEKTKEMERKKMHVAGCEEISCDGTFFVVFV
jgi:hypothetical protein